MHVASSSGGPKVMAVATRAAISVPMTAQCRNVPVGSENGVRASTGDVAPHPAQHDQVREESGGKPKTQRASRPAKRAADSCG